MARKTKTVRIPAGDSRDAGKTFLLTEMSAADAEKWAIRAMRAISNAGVEVPPEVIESGMGAIALAGIRSLLTMGFADAEPLLDEMMDCVQIVPDPKNPSIVRPADDEDIEEIGTRVTLRSEVFELHTGFSPTVALSELKAAVSKIRDFWLSLTSLKLSDDSSPTGAQP